MDSLFFNRNKIFWMLTSVIVFILLISFYVLDGVKFEEQDRAFESSLHLPGINQIFFGHDLIKFSDITSKVEQFDQATGGTQLLHIRATKYIEMGTIISVIRDIQKARHQRIGLPTRFEKKLGWMGLIDFEVLALTEGCNTQNESVRIEVKRIDDSQKQVYLNSQLTMNEEIFNLLKQETDFKQEKMISVYVSEKLIYEDVTDVLDTVRRAGVKVICLKLTDDIPASRNTSLKR
ncbi:MAG: hypothetical protein AB1757_21470 [Acidobacteriota bacterium]